MSRLPRTRGGLLPAFVLANAATVLAYLPFLSLLLPLKVEALAGAGRVVALSVILGSGAVAASIANIVVGIAIDRSRARGGGRRRWIVAGLVATMAGYAAIVLAHTAVALLGAVILFQTAVNVLVAPVMLVMVEDMRDAERGLAGGLMTLAQPLAMLAGAGLVMLYDRGEGAAYLAICVGVAVLVMPLLVVQARTLEPPVVVPAAQRPPRHLIALAASRLLLLTANSVLAGVLVYYFESVTGHLGASNVARRVGLIAMLANTLAVPAAVGLATRAHGRGQRKVVAVAAAFCGTGALAVMALAAGWVVPAIGYGLFVAALQVYVAQHSALVAQTLRATRHPARDLGLQNLANTIPAVLGPGLVLVLYAWSGIAALLATAVVLAAMSGLVLAMTAID